MANYRRQIGQVLVEGTDHGYNLTLPTRNVTHHGVVQNKTETMGRFFKKQKSVSYGPCEQVLVFAGHELWVEGPKQAAIVFETLARQVRYQQDLLAKKKPGLLARLWAAFKG